MHISISGRMFPFHCLISVSIFLLCFATEMNAQSVISYNYDSAGNRILRQFVTEHNYSVPNQRTIERPIPIMDINAYPSPTTGHVTIEIPQLGNEADCTISVCDVAGRQILTKVVHSTITDIDLSQHPSGYYILQIIINGDDSIIKIIKE